MNAVLSRAAAAGAAGAITTNVLHETVRRVAPAAPRVDLLGMQALAKTVAGAGGTPPTGNALYRATLASDLVSNAAYFGLAATARRSTAVALGLGLGIVAGIGAVVLPPPMGLDGTTTARSLPTALMTIALYGAGGAVAGLVARSLGD